MKDFKDFKIWKFLVSS